MVDDHGWEAWLSSMVEKYGWRAWSRTMVKKHGWEAWLRSVIEKCDWEAWLSSMVEEHGWVYYVSWKKFVCRVRFLEFSHNFFFPGSWVVPVAVVAAIVLTAIILLAAYVLVKRRRYVLRGYETSVMTSLSLMYVYFSLKKKTDTILRVLWF
jgi:hypothetical protein